MPAGSTITPARPPEVRLTFVGRKKEGRASLEKMIAWRPEKVIMAHGRPYERDGTAELRRAFRWLVSKG